jgi:hypothetical protein
MTTAQALSKFDILLDKYGSPYFEESEKLEFLNMAQLEVLNRMVPDSLGGVVNFEMDANTLDNLTPLIYKISATPSTGIVLKSALNTTLQAASSDASATVFRVGNVFVTSNSKPVKFTKHNNIVSYINNVFKAPSESDPRYVVTALNYTVYPETIGALTFTVLKTPRIMTAGNSPDWDDYVMNQVILQAVKLAGVPLRDEEIQQDVRLTGFQSAQ